MRKHSMPEIKEANVNVTPLIDIVMCLIIFYMLVAKIGVASTVNDPNLKLPESNVGNTITDPGNTLTILIEQMPGSNMDEPQIRAINEAGQEETFRLVDPQTQRKPFKEFLVRMKGRNDKFKVIIRADENLNYRHIEPALLTLAEARVQEYLLETRKPK